MATKNDLGLPRGSTSKRKQKYDRTLTKMIARLYRRDGINNKIHTIFEMIADVCPKNVYDLFKSLLTLLALFFQGVTVQEGDDCLITRLKGPWHLEVRREFSPRGMVQVIEFPRSQWSSVKKYG